MSRTRAEPQSPTIATDADHRRVTERSSNSLARKVELMARLAASRTLHEKGFAAAMSEITETGAAVLDVARCGIWQLWQKDGTARLVDAFDSVAVAHSSGSRIQVDVIGDFYDQARTKGIVAIADVSVDPLVRGLYDSFFRPMDVQATLAAPIWRGTELFGTVGFSHVGGTRHWTEAERGLAVAMAAVVSRTLEAEERRQTRAVLEQREARFRALIEESTDLIATRPVDGPYSYLSPSIRALLGYDPQDLSEPVYSELIHPDDLGSFLQQRERAVAQPGSTIGERIRIKHANGAYRWFDLRVRYLPDRIPDGPIVTNGRDITEQVKAEDELHRIRDALVRQVEVLERLAASKTLVERGLSAALAQISEEAATGLGVERVHIRLLDPASGDYSGTDMYDARGHRHWRGEPVPASTANLCLVGMQRDGLVAIDDVAGNAVLAEVFRTHNPDFMPRSSMTAAIRRHDAYAGYISVYCASEPRHWTEQDKSLLSALAGYASRVLEAHDRQEAEAQIRAIRDALANQVEVLARLASSRTLAERGLQAALEEFTEETAKALGAHRVGIRLLDPSLNAYAGIDIFEVQTGQHHHDQPIPATETAELLVHLSRGSVIATDNVAAASWIPRSLQDILNDAGVRSVMITGLWRLGKFAGALVINHAGTVRKWSEQDKSLLGALAGYLSRLLESHERQVAEQALANREAYFRALIENAHDGITVLSADGRIKYQSPAVEPLLGYRPEFLAGRLVFDFIHPDDVKPGIQVLQRISKTETPVTVTLRFRHADGRWRILEAAGRKLPETSGVNGAIVNYHDVTERVENERRLRDQEARLRSLQSDLSQAMRVAEMGELSAAIAHELNQPLAAVVNFAQASQHLCETVAFDDRDRVIHYMERAVQQAERAATIISRLRQFYEKGEIQARPEDLPAVIEDVMVLAALDRKVQQCRVTVSIDKDMPRVLADRVQIQQVILNLVRNAAEAMAKQVRREITITAVDTGARIEVSVADTGPGIAPDMIANLFSPLASNKSSGLGLGLPISKSIVEAHGGTLRAENRVGGTSFVFDLAKA